MQQLNKNKPSHISQVVKDIFGELDKAGVSNPDKVDISTVWVKAAGQKAARHSSPASLRNKTLLVSVDSSAWIYQLRLKEQELIKKMAKLLNKQEIEKIRFRAGL
jgi:predicted nucleic acid-binding Zn ribbon protein